MFATLDLPLRDDNRHKRLKVGRACHPCRMKKIKCDGKQPCMQCKARRRKCMYMKNTDATYIKLDPDDTYQQTTNNDNNGLTESTTIIEQDQLFQIDHHEQSCTYPTNVNYNTLVTRSDKMMEQLTQGLVQLTLHQDTSQLKQETLTPWRNYGDFVRWTTEPPLPRHFSASLEMPSRAVQEQLIQTFFTHCHTLLPTMSKGMFYDQLHTKGPLITPLLLNMIYAHASAYQHQQPPPPLGMPPSSTSLPSLNIDSDMFYQRARQLLDGFLDEPRISTVIALLYMVSYEDNTQYQIQHNGQRRPGRTSRAWMYSGMAIRMCLELGLHTSHYSSQMSQFDIELRKRVLWTCYVMDKLESCTMERPWMLRSQDITLDLPTPLPEDDQQERNILDGFAQLCRLMMLVEKVLSFFTYENRTSDGDWTTKEEAQVLYFLDQLMQWRSLLPEEFQWHPSDGLRLPTSFIVTNLHLLSYDLELSLVLCCRFQMEQLQYCERRRSLANTITRIVTLTVQYPHLMYTSAISGFSGIFAALVHASDVDHARLEVAKDAKQQFRLTLETIRGLVDKIPMRDVRQFVGLIDTFLRPSNDPSSSTTPSLSPAFSYAMNGLYHINSIPPTGNHTTINDDHKKQSTLEQDKMMQRMLGTQDIYEAQLMAKTLTTLQHHHHHHQHRRAAFPTPFTTPSPPPSNHTENNTILLEEQQQRQKLYPVVSSSSSTSTASSSPSAGNATIRPGTNLFAFSSQAAEAAAAAAAAAVGAVGPPVTNYQQQTSQQHMSMTIPTGDGPIKSIEPADYTFELISVDDEWAKSLIY
ncbi:fungal-specific transcription factor domain-containing protein [Halteromyces radiatus]|uniref:fungal-specific transcription factor domain-containing protein n=1 Tax=Halteromyces radiatus TaxID=101107 RepID=UPI002220EE29|nr:fungal-specific transcription factor domain-containing protein [Halteromyces radiatus]KAI8089279.1 fungal-specific transcription factor domain-containing protein [Halteromyces radiatus]